MTVDVLYQWPSTAAIGKALTKTKLYERATVATAVRERFVAEVKSITWAYKLADLTLHLRGTPNVPEIQVFVVTAKEEDVSAEVLTAIDKAVRFPIVFEVVRGEGATATTRMVASAKQLRSGEPRLRPYLSTNWQPIDRPRQPLPTALDLPSLYVELLRPLLPLDVRPGEDAVEATSRLTQVRKLEREVVALERRMRNEPQLNRKIELRRQLRDRTTALEALTNPARRENEDARWTS